MVLYIPTRSRSHGHSHAHGKSSSSGSHHHRQPQGLVVRMCEDYERMVLSDAQICDDAMATIPKLKAAAIQGTQGHRWTQRRRKCDVDLFELVPGGGDDPEDDLDIAHALVAKTEIRCHLNEVLGVVINRDTAEYESTMKALCGKPFKRGRMLFTQHRRLPMRHRKTAESIETTTTSRSSNNTTEPCDESLDSSDNAAARANGLISVQLATLRPKFQVKLGRSNHKRTQKLCFASCTLQYPGEDRAIHVTKTIPKDAHDQVVPRDDRSALRRGLDHIAMGLDIHSKHGDYSARSHLTTIMAYTYASAVPASEYSVATDHNLAFKVPASEIARHRKALMNPEARNTMELLTKSLRKFEKVIRRRRFGFQSFVYFPTTDPENKNVLPVASSTCQICSKRFRFFRRDLFCQLCGHAVCKDCSQVYDVEAQRSVVRKNRCCIQCVVRVDSCVFDDQDLLSALGPVVVDVDEAAWESESLLADSTASSIQSLEQISGSLYSNDPIQRSLALDRLAQLVQHPTRKNHNRTLSIESQNQNQNQQNPQNQQNHQHQQKQKLFHDVDHHVVQSLRNVNKQNYSAQNCFVYDRQRDHAYEFADSNRLVPLAPQPTWEKEAMRLHYLNASGALHESYDREALDLLAKVAAERLGCPMGWVSALGETHLTVIAGFQYPENAKVVPRDEAFCTHGVYAETPMVLKNTATDMRFALLPAVKELHFKFYAGFPIKAPDGSVVASLCVGDTKPHDHITTKQYATMEVLSELAAQLVMGE